MKKKLMIGLLTVVTCFTLGSTSFAASDMTKTSNNTTTENVKVAPYASKDIYRGIFYSKQDHPDGNDIPNKIYYSEGFLSGWLTLVEVRSASFNSWIAYYEGTIN
ncbi:hypothetical protein ABIC86_000131 [Paenibacillus sp. DS2363]|uniref:hypothetical protein n=1 Tax=Paenibacillus sp. DS2363 TaxID=3156427 RepID=UPI00339350F3